MAWSQIWHASSFYVTCVLWPTIGVIGVTVIDTRMTCRFVSWSRDMICPRELASLPGRWMSEPISQPTMCGNNGCFTVAAWFSWREDNTCPHNHVYMYAIYYLCHIIMYICMLYYLCHIIMYICMLYYVCHIIMYICMLYYVCHIIMYICMLYYVYDWTNQWALLYFIWIKFIF